MTTQNRQEWATARGRRSRSRVPRAGAVLGGVVLLVSILPMGAADAAPNCFGRPATIVGTEGNDNLRGTSRADVIVGLGGRDEINGLGGVDRLCGQRGPDTVSGGPGSDKLSGGETSDQLSGGDGNDLLDGNTGYDQLNGDLGTDVASYSYGANEGLGVDLAQGFAVGGQTSAENEYLDQDSLSGIENVIGTRFADSFHGDTKSNAFYGGDDMDSLWGSGGNDRLYGEAGNDTVYGDAGNDVMNGGSGDDSVGYYQSPGPVIVNLSTGKASGRGSDTVSNSNG